MLGLGRVVILALALLSGAEARGPTPATLSSDYSFEQYARDFNRRYTPDSKEWAIREKLFTQRRDAILAHNAANAGWKQNVNEFSDKTPDELKGNGLHKSLLHSQTKARSHTQVQLRGANRPHQHPPAPKAIKDLPTNVDWRDQGVVTPVKNQGHCGSCWSFSATEALESHIAVSTGHLFTLSEQQFVECMPNPESCGGTGGCEGATFELAFEYAMTNGLSTEWTAPYTSYFGDVKEECGINVTENSVAGITGYVNTRTNNYEDLMTAVATQGPVAITVDASVWHSYDSGIFDGCNQTNPELDHGVLLVGYGTDEDLGMDYWLIRNSWGPTWGEEGYIRIRRTESEGTRCGTDINPHMGVACDGEDDPIEVCGTCGILYDTAYPTGGFTL